MPAWQPDTPPAVQPGSPATGRLPYSGRHHPTRRTPPGFFKLSRRPPAAAEMPGSLLPSSLFTRIIVARHALPKGAQHAALQARSTPVDVIGQIQRFVLRGLCHQRILAFWRMCVGAFRRSCLGAGMIPGRVAPPATSPTASVSPRHGPRVPRHPAAHALSLSLALRLFRHPGAQQPIRFRHG